MKAYLILLACIVPFQNCTNRLPKTQKEKHYVVVMAGQSNMQGQGKVEEVGAVEVPANIKYFNVNRPSDFKPSPRAFGPERGVMKTLGEQFPDVSFIVIKYAIGGSSLLDWAPHYDAERAKITGHPEHGNLFRTLMTSVDSITENYNAEFLAFMWMQGERDARVPEAGKKYHKNFSEFILEIKKRTSEDLPFIYGLVNPDPDIYPALEIVQAAQKRIATEFENVYLIDTSMLDKKEDNVHYSTAGQMELGKKFGNQLLEIIRNRRLSKKI